MKWTRDEVSDWLMRHAYDWHMKKPEFRFKQPRGALTESDPTFEDLYKAAEILKDKGYLKFWPSNEIIEVEITSAGVNYWEKKCKEQS